jgi:hypothetical protein
LYKNIKISLFLSSYINDFMDFTTNYCGPYWSDGKFQSSVVDGKSNPVSQLDAECKRHDSAYATAKTEEDLVNADQQFYTATQTLGVRGPIYGNLVLHGNKVARLYKNLLQGKNMKWFSQSKAPLGDDSAPVKAAAAKEAAKKQQEAAAKKAAEQKAAVKKNAVAPAPTTTNDKADMPASDMPRAAKAIDAWQEDAFVHPTAGHTGPSTGYGPDDSGTHVFGFHEYIPPYRPLRKKKQRPLSDKREEAMTRRFLQEHPPTTKHIKNCTTCHVLKQSPKYQQLLSRLVTPSAAHKRA